MKKTLYFDEYCGYAIFAAIENGKLCEFDFERQENRAVRGNVYKGRIVNVLPGMQAAFVDCGLGKNCYLSTDEQPISAEKYDGNCGEKAVPVLKEGDEIIVQIVRPAQGNKGAKVTLYPSIVGKNAIYLPKTPFVGVSRKIADDELRANLAYSIKSLLGDGEGVVLRTSAPYARRNVIEKEIASLKEIYDSAVKQFNTAPAGATLYTELGLFKRVLRDTLNGDIEKIVVGSEKIKKTIEDFYAVFTPERQRPVEVYSQERDMLYECGISEQIKKITSNRAELENGGYLIIDRCEAMTVIDVNTGAFIGNDSLEHTVYYTNVLAAREIARQVKLRNIGGIVVVDFIDMTNQTHDKNVVKELESALKKYGSKCDVGETSRFGLVEFTRKREGISALEIACVPCDKCGKGVIISPKFALLEMRARLLRLYSTGHKKALVDVGAELLPILDEWREFKQDLKARMPDSEFYLSPRNGCTDDLRFTLDDFEITPMIIRLC